MKQLIDHHVHFTGSLSNKFLNTQGLNITEKTDWNLNYHNFFEIYKTRKELFKRLKQPMEEKYYQGTLDIAQQYFEEEIDQFQLRVGIKPYIVSMIEAIEYFEKKHDLSDFGKLVITLISDEKGNIINCSSDILEKFFDEINSKKAYNERIIGFDFSGPEDNMDINLILKYIDAIKCYSSDLEIMVHIGEFTNIEKWQEVFRRIELLLDKNINRISHGTMLWLNPKLISETEEAAVKKEQNKLLKRISDQKTIIEICPSANFLMSPLDHVNDIPFELFQKLNINYTINTDNRTIFNTSLKKELGLVL